MYINRSRAVTNACHDGLQIVHGRSYSMKPLLVIGKQTYLPDPVRRGNVEPRFTSHARSPLVAAKRNEPPAGSCQRHSTFSISIGFLPHTSHMRSEVHQFNLLELWESILHCSTDTLGDSRRALHTHEQTRKHPDHTFWTL